MKKFLFTFLVSMVAFHCSTSPQVGQGSFTEDQEGIVKRVVERSWADSVLQSMSLEEKVGQLMIVWTTSYYMPDGRDAYRSSNDISARYGFSSHARCKFSVQHGIGNCKRSTSTRRPSKLFTRG
ncbi:MAG: hypothetical protein HYV29_12995 [Ignavibacteriales bacterium]|nr:hypothetical protein [Ignavibacteriales bacterium]